MVRGLLGGSMGMEAGGEVEDYGGIVGWSGGVTDSDACLVVRIGRR